MILHHSFKRGFLKIVDPRKSPFKNIHTLARGFGSANLDPHTFPRSVLKGALVASGGGKAMPGNRGSNRTTKTIGIPKFPKTSLFKMDGFFKIDEHLG